MIAPVQVSILGQTFSLRSEASPEEIHRVAAFVNEQIAEVAAGSRTVDSLNLALLALLNVAGAYLRQQAGTVSSSDNDGGNDGGPADKELEGRLGRLVERIAQTRSSQTG